MCHVCDLIDDVKFLDQLADQFAVRLVLCVMEKFSDRSEAEASGGNARSEDSVQLVGCELIEIGENRLGFDVFGLYSLDEWGTTGFDSFGESFLSLFGNTLS